MFFSFANVLLFCLLPTELNSVTGSHQREVKGYENQQHHTRTRNTEDDTSDVGTTQEDYTTKSILAFVLSANKPGMNNESGTDAIDGGLDMINAMKSLQGIGKDSTGKIVNNVVRNTTVKGSDLQSKTKRTQRRSDGQQHARYKMNLKMEPKGHKTIERCILQVSKKSAKAFNKLILYEKANIITLRLRFSNSLNVTWSSGVILPFEWRWVFKETYSYLKMPYAAFVWSLGLLYLHSKGPIDIELDYVHDMKHCPDLTIGKKESDKIIGNALGNMTQLIALQDMRYNTSQWCYQRKIPKQKRFIPFDVNFLHTNPALEYICCSYKLNAPKIGVKCFQKKTYDSVWWDIHQTLGTFMLLYFPVLFMKMSGKIHKKIKMSSAGNSSLNEERKNAYKVIPTDDIVYLEDELPVSATSMIISVITDRLPSKQSTKSRLAIFVWSLATLTLPAIELLLWYIYLYDFAIDLAKNNVSFGFSSMIAGWKASRSTKLSLFGGPFVALGIYVVIGWVITLCPKTMADQMYLGVTSDEKETKKSILWLSLNTKETLGSVEIGSHRNGYTRSYKLHICHLYMLLNPDFWILEWDIEKVRWRTFVSVLAESKSIRMLIILFCFPIYILLVLMEIFVAFFFYSIPMLSFFACVVKGLSLGLDNYLSENVSNRCRSARCFIRFSFCITVLSCLIYYLYIFSILFLQSFYFLSRLLVFTYTALVAYPKETYGYFMLILTTISFGISCFFSFGDIYKLILEIAIERCRKEPSLEKYLFSKNDLCKDDVYGISRELFEYLIEHIRPRRVQMFHTLLRLASMTLVLSVSIEIMVGFEKFEDLSFFVHVFVTMFICALPSIYKSLVSAKQDNVKLTRKIDRFLRAWDLNKCLNE